MTRDDRDLEIERLNAKVACLESAADGFGAERSELKAIIVEMQKALDAALADLERYRALVDQHRPNEPEHVATIEQQLVLEGMLAALAAAPPAANDAPACDPPPIAAPSPERDEPREEKPARTGHGRRSLDLTALPVDTVVIDPPEVIAAGGVGYTLVDAEESDRIAFSPARFIRLRLVRRTFRKDIASATLSANEPTEEKAATPDAILVTAPIPDAVWPRVMADPSAIAHAIVSKYDDLLPLHRQEKITAREGFTVPRSTLCGWFTPAVAVLGGVVDAMFLDSKATAPYLAVDATGAPVRGKKKTACAPWHVFVFVAAHEHIVFRHSRTHDSIVLGEMLRGYRGYLLADASSIYAPLVTAGIITLACCWAHVRRYFYRALETDRARSLEAIAIIGKLFEVERHCANTPPADKTKRRAELAAPVLQMFDDWLARHRPNVEPRTPLQAAITYADNQHDELRRFLDDGRLRIDNNVCEGQLRHLVLGKNNWQYFETETGLRWYTVFRSLISSCKLHDICPHRYLECVLRLGPHWSQRRLLELSPKYWRATAARLTPEQIATVRPPWSAAFDVFAPLSSTTAPAEISPETVAA